MRAIVPNVRKGKKAGSVEWDRSVTSLHDEIHSIADLDLRASLLARLNELVQEASFPPVETKSNLLFSIGYDVIVDLSHSVATQSDEIRRRLSIPISRPCIAKFRDSDAPSEAEPAERMLQMMFPVA